jgi:hypothetical protein
VIALLDNGQDLDECEAEIGVSVGQLLTPLTRYRLRDPSRPWAIDNGGYKRLDIAAFDALLARETHHKANCLFVAAPDIVGSAQRTLELFTRWHPKLEGWPVALVCQDGQEMPAAGDAAWDAARDTSRVAARAAAEIAGAAGGAAGVAAWAAARAAAWDAARACSEIQGARIMREKGQAFTFLPMFGFADPEAVLAAIKETQP